MIILVPENHAGSDIRTGLEVSVGKINDIFAERIADTVRTLNNEEGIENHGTVKQDF